MSPLTSYENGIFLRTLEGNRPLLACLNKLHYIPMTSHDKLRLSHFPVTHTQQIFLVTSSVDVMGFWNKIYWISWIFNWLYHITGKLTVCHGKWVIYSWFTKAMLVYRPNPCGLCRQDMQSKRGGNFRELVAALRRQGGKGWWWRMCMIYMIYMI